MNLPKDLRDNLPRAHGVEALPVIHGQRPLVLRQRHLFLVKHQLLYGIQRIRHIGDAEALGPGEIVNRAALLDGLPPLNAVVHHTGQIRQGASGGMSHIDGIVRVHQQGNIVLHLLFVSVIKFLEAGHLLHSPGLDADLLPLVPSVREHQLQGTAHIVEGRVMPALRLAGLLGLHTADDIVLPGVLQGKPPAEQGGNDHLVIVISRKSYPCAGQIRRLHQQVVGGLVPHPDRKGGLGQEHMFGCRDAHKAQVVGHVHPFLILAAHDQILEQAVASEALRAGGVPAFVQVI